MLFPIKSLSIPVNYLRNKNIWIAGFATIAFLIVWLAPFYPVGVGVQGYAPLHVALEVFAVVIAGAIFAVGWHGQVDEKTGCTALMAAGFCGVALMDVAHILSFQGMPEWVTPSGGGKAINFWFVARYLAAFSILALVIGTTRRTYPRSTGWVALVIVFGIVSVSCWLVLWRAEWLPVFLVEEKGLTPIKIGLEWLLVFISIITLIIVWQKRDQATGYDPQKLAVALWLTALSELCFTLYSDAADMFNLMGHIYKVFSYGFLYQAIVVGSLKLPQKLLSENREVLQQLLDNIHQVFWLRSVDRKQMLYVSPAYEKIWQRSCKSVLESPESWFDAIHPEDRDYVKQALPLQLDGNYNVEYRIIRPDNTERWIRAKTFPIRDAKNNVLRIAGVADDITEQVRAAKALYKNERLLNQTQAIAHLGSWEFDVANDHFTWSDEVYRIFGLSQQEFPGNYEAFLGTVHPDDRSAIDYAYRQSLEQGCDDYEAEFRIIRGDTKEVRYVHEKCYHAKDASGNVIRSVGMVHDVTEYKQSEAEREKLQMQLAQAHKMEAIGHLTGGIAHDFNNMLGSIIGYAGLLKRFNGGRNLSHKQQSYVEEILIAGNRAKELISQMLVFSRLNPDGTEGKAPVTLMQPVLKEIVQLLQSSIPSTININYQITDETLKARIVAVQLHQILLNLAINARDAIDEYGRIDLIVNTRTIEDVCGTCHEAFSGEYVEIIVRDTGKGIPANLLPKIFDPFFTTKEVGKGTGMGLSVVHGMVHTLGGHITINSGVGQGTTVSVLLPAISSQSANADDQVTQKQENTKTALSGIHILVVDDEQSITMMLAEFLTLFGADVVTYNNSVDASNAFKKDPEKFDVVITDETMPKLSGMDLAKTLTQIRPDLPVILCTGYSERVNENIAKQHGIAGFMYKPIDFDALLTLVSRLCRKELLEIDEG